MPGRVSLVYGEVNELDFISYYIDTYGKYSDDGKTIYGGYGPRLFNAKGSINQIQNVLELLKKTPSSRKAVIQLFDSEDLLDTHGILKHHFG